jgi:hypothetical protein
MTNDVRYRFIPGTKHAYWFDVIQPGEPPELIGSVSKRPQRPFDTAVWVATDKHNKYRRVGSTRQSAVHQIINLISVEEVHRASR